MGIVGAVPCASPGGEHKGGDPCSRPYEGAHQSCRPKTCPYSHYSYTKQRMTQTTIKPPPDPRIMTLLKPQHLIPSLTSGFVVGLLEIVFAISFATLLFTGPMADYRPLGIGLALLGGILSSIIITLFTSLPGTLGGNQEVPAIIMTLITAEIVLAAPAGAASSAILITVLVAISITTLLTGFAFLALGYFKLGNLVRFLPYPVVGGFLAGTGWLLAAGAISIMAPLPQDFSQLTLFLDPEALFRWLPGVIIGCILLVWTQRSDNFLILPGVLFISLILFYTVAWAAGVSLTQLQHDGWLLGPFTGKSLWRPFPIGDLVNVQWQLISSQAIQILAIVLVSTVGLLLNAGGVELATKKDMDLNRELRVAGFGNLLAGLVPGLISFQQLGLTVINFKLGANNRLTGLIGVLFCVVVLIFGASLLSLVPQIIIGGMLFYLGLSFLAEWVVDSWFKLPKTDYLIVISILLVTIAIGFLEAVAFGVLLASILFVVGYSRIDILRHEFTGASVRSRYTRPPSQRQILYELGEQHYILQLQGFIFFGTADQLLNRVRRRLNDGNQPTLKGVFLDFARITGLDSTGILSFSRMKQVTQEKGVMLIFIAPSADIRNQLEKGGLEEDGEFVFYFPNLDRAIQWGEDRLLAQAEESRPDKIGTLIEQLEILMPGETNIESMLGYFELLDVQAGERLIGMGDQADDLYIIGSGRVTAQIPRPNQTAMRLETTGIGNVIGEIGFYLNIDRTADVVVDEPGFVYRLSLKELQRMEQEDPKAAASLHRLMVHLLAKRVRHLMESINALE